MQEREQCLPNATDIMQSRRLAEHHLGTPTFAPWQCEVIQPNVLLGNAQSPGHNNPICPPDQPNASNYGTYTAPHSWSGCHHFPISASESYRGRYLPLFHTRCSASPYLTLNHGGRDAERAVPVVLRAGVRDALCRTFFGGVRDAAGDFASDGFVVETEGEADLDGDADGEGGLGG